MLYGEENLSFLAPFEDYGDQLPDCVFQAFNDCKPSLVALSGRLGVSSSVMSDLGSDQ